MIQFILKYILFFHNFLYKLISKLAIIANHGIHPKHDILKYEEFFLNCIDPADTIVDIGCSSGEVTRVVASKAKKVVGIEIEPKKIAKAKGKKHINNLTYIVGDATNYTFEDKFDKIILSNVLEHIENRIDFLKKMHTISDTILLRVPMIDRDWITIYKKQLDIEYRLDKTHYIEYTINSLKKELKESGWNLDSFSIQFGECWGKLIMKKK